VKDNKNRYLLAFLSLLTTREVFEEVKLRFLMVGHVDENIDGCFGYLSKKLRKQNIYILANLMVSWSCKKNLSFHNQFKEFHILKSRSLIV